MKETESVYAFLYRDRNPFARADIYGGDGNRAVGGCVSFYTTPLGVLVRAELCGLPRGRHGKRAYNFCIRESDECECQRSGEWERRSMCSLMPTAYERDGRAECSIITRRIEPSDIVGKRIVIYDRINGCPRNIASAVASGSVNRFGR